MLNNPDNAKSLLMSLKASVLTVDREQILKEASSYLSVSLTSTVNWLCVWDDARDHVQFWINSFIKLITTPCFNDRCWPKCKDKIPEFSTFIEHFSTQHWTFW